MLHRSEILGRTRRPDGMIDMTASFLNQMNID
jgi:hypothetical protein